MKPILLFPALLLAIPLAACGDDYVHPIDALKQRVVHASAAGNAMVSEAQSTLKCPTGMKSVVGEHDVVLENDTRFEYREESPGSSSGYSTRGRLRGSYSTYSSQDVEVEAETETQSRGRIRCVSVIDLSPAR